MPSLETKSRDYHSALVSTSMPTKKKPNARPFKRRRPLTPAEQTFVDEWVSNGGKSGEAMQVASPHVTPRSAGVLGHHALRRPEIRERIQECIEAATGATPAEVVGRLVLMMRADLTDLMREDGTIDLKLLRTRRMGNLVHRIAIRQEYLELVSEGNGNGNGHGKGKPNGNGNGNRETLVRRAEIISLELHDQRAAANDLARLMRIEDEVKDAAQKAATKLRIQRFIQEYAERRFGGDLKKAEEAYLAQVPEHRRFL